MPHYRISFPNKKYLFFEADQGVNEKERACELVEEFIHNTNTDPIPLLLVQMIDETTKKLMKKGQTFVLKHKTIKATLSNGTIIQEQFYMTTYS